jgi:hypothetical protein
MTYLGAGNPTPPMVTDTAVRVDRVSGSRQKSCNACVRGKRRCDKRTPNCTRCAAKGLDCVYQRMPPCSTMSEAPNMADFDMSFDMEGLSTETSPNSLQTDLSLHLDPVLDFSIQDLVSGGSGNGVTLSPSSDDNELDWGLPQLTQDFGGASKMDIPPVPTVPDLPLRDLSVFQIASKCDVGGRELEVGRIYEPGSKLGYVLKAISNMHHDFSKTRALPFMHQRLWSVNPPKTIMAAWSAAMAQANASPENKGWACKTIMESAREIHREGEYAVTPRDKLARLQAFLIVQAIKMFDGDIAMRSTAEREMKVLVEWAKDLSNVLSEMAGSTTPEQATSRNNPPSDWDSWILSESIRRSLVMCMSMTCMIAMLQGTEMPFTPCDGIPPYFTASKHLWEASTSGAFYRAWSERRQFAINRFSFSELWQFGRADDLDDFTRLLLTSQAGPEIMDEHFPPAQAGMSC